MDLWERGIHTGLVRYSEVEGSSREGGDVIRGEEEDEAVARIYHDTVLSGNLRKAICQSTNMEGGGCLLPDDHCTNTRRTVSEFLLEKHLDMQVRPVENPTFTSFEEYREVP